MLPLNVPLTGARRRDTAWAMSEENVEVVRRFCERDDQTSLDSLMASLHPDIEWVPVQSDPEYSIHRGHDDVRAWFDVLGRVVS